MTAVAELNAARREVLYALAELGEEAPVAASEIPAALPSACPITEQTARYHLLELVATPLVEDVGRMQNGEPGGDPRGFRLTDAGRRALEEDILRHLEQLESHPFELGLGDVIGIEEVPP